MDDLQALVSYQHHELHAASAAESDLDIAFRLQLQEALAASLSTLPSSSSSSLPTRQPPPSVLEEEDPSAIDLQALEIRHFLQESSDAHRCRAEMSLVSDRVRLLAHDRRFAREIEAVPDDVWERDGDNIHRPFRGSGGSDDGDPFELYFKGLASGDLAALGVAVCDPHGGVLLKIQRPVTEGLPPMPGKKLLDATALAEGLQAALSLGFTRLNVYVDTVSLYNHLTGKWPIKQRRIGSIIEQISLLQRKFEMCNMHLLPRSQIQFVIKLAKDIIDSHIMNGNERHVKQQSKETCIICLEEIESSSMFAVNECKHQFCFSCMKQHVEVKLLLGILPECPHEGCKIKLDVESSKKFLPPKLSQIMADRVLEASIPEVEKVYCPYPKCSALMSRRDTIIVDLGSSSNQSFRDTCGARKCIRCKNLFCIICKVPWHVGMSCKDYERYLPFARPDDAKLKALARSRLWRQCIKCNQMIELAEGCYHMTCRCGYEFCYTCGAPWIDKKATCSCPLWDEHFILRNQNNVHRELVDDFDSDDYHSDDDYY